MLSRAGILAVVLSSMVLFSGARPAAGEAPGFLLVRGAEVVDPSGRPVRLRGFNVEFKDFMTVLGEGDIRKIAGAGANSIRLALSYRDLESAPFVYDNGGFALLDSILNWCERHGLYVVLDMHLAPGAQNAHDFVVHRESTAGFWHRKDYLERFLALWGEIARRYAGRWVVAGYDLLNEPAPPEASAYRRVMDAASRKVREHDGRHILIVEEAILPRGRKELVLVEDANALYSIHFFHPPRFAFYATTTERPITNYPGEMVTAGPLVGETSTRSIAPEGEWSHVELRATPPPGADILVVSVSSTGNRSAAFFDDIELRLDGRVIDLPAPLVRNGSFETDYPGFNWTVSDGCVAPSDEEARTGGRSLMFSGCEGRAWARSSPIPVEKGRYALTAWYKSPEATGDTRLSISWHAKRTVSSVDRGTLREAMGYALRFKARHKVPLFVGEFTAHANPSPESVRNYLNDLLEIMEGEGLHWSFWEYYSVYRGVGIHNGEEKTLVNAAAWETLKKHMR